MRHGLGARRYLLPFQKVTVAGLLLAGPSLEPPPELAPAEAVERLLDRSKVCERMQSFTVLLQLAESLWSPQHQDAKQSPLVGSEAERLVQ